MLLENEFSTMDSNTKKLLYAVLGNTCRASTVFMETLVEYTVNL